MEEKRGGSRRRRRRRGVYGPIKMSDAIKSGWEGIQVALEETCTYAIRSGWEGSAVELNAMPDPA